MSVELACSDCDGRFLVENTGTVACPHCGTHLSVSEDALSEAGPVSGGATVPDELPARGTPGETSERQANAPAFQSLAGLAENAEDEEAQDAPLSRDVPPHAPSESSEARRPDGDRQPAADAESDVAERPTDGVSAELRSPSGDRQQHGAGDAPEDAPTVTLAEFNESQELSSGNEFPTDLLGDLGSHSRIGDPSEEFPDFTDLPEENDEENDIDALLATAEQAEVLNDEQSVESRQGGFSSAEVSTEIRAPVADSRAAASPKPHRGGVPTSWFVIVLSYASAVTIMCVWLLIRLMSGTHQLENLADPVDAPSGSRKKTVWLYRVDLKMPRGHTLKLGESRRYGNILVEPLRVTRGPLEFVHFADDEGVQRSGSAPVLKLWLRFRNVSDDQTIAPLDKTLLYTNRVRSKEDYDRFRSNIFVCRREDKTASGHLVHVYDLNTDDIWDLKDQHLGRELQPGESLVTYIPTSESGTGRLKGNLVWRVHFRKGYSPGGYGVTTLTEVEFHSDQIRNESATRETTASL